jgi:hypothetical protein
MIFHIKTTTQAVTQTTIALPYIIVIIMIMIQPWEKKLFKILILVFPLLIPLQLQSSDGKKDYLWPQLMGYELVAESG